MDMMIWYKKLNRTIDCARSKKRLLCSCTHGQTNGFSKARKFRKIHWIQKPKRFVLYHSIQKSFAHFFWLAAVCSTQYLFQPKYVEIRFYSHVHSMQHLSRALMDRIWCGLWRHQTTVEAVEREQSNFIRRGEHVFTFRHPLRCVIDHDCFKQFRPQKHKTQSLANFKREGNKP